MSNENRKMRRMKEERVRMFEGLGREVKNGIERGNRDKERRIGE